jgi:glycerol kinase
VREATGLGAALLAGIPVGHHGSVDELATTWKPRATVQPGPPLDRDRWKDAVARSRRWIHELSGIGF